MDIIAEIRCRHLVSGESITSIARSLNLPRPAVRKHLRTTSSPSYQRQHQPALRLTEPFPQLLTAGSRSSITKVTASNRTAPVRGLQVEGYLGSYDCVRRLVKRWKAGNTRPSVTQAFVPLRFAPGEVCQFDWSQEQVDIDGVSQKVKVAHFRLTYSRQMFVVAYPRETQEMLFDAHNRAFAFFGGVPQRMVYDNLKAVVQTILSGKARQFNPRFMALANHYLFEPVACTPASGWGKPGFRKACFALPLPVRHTGRTVGRGARGRWRIRWATSGNGCLRPSRALPVWPILTTGWRCVAGN